MLFTKLHGSSHRVSTNTAVKLQEQGNIKTEIEMEDDNIGSGGNIVYCGN